MIKKTTAAGLFEKSILGFHVTSYISVGSTLNGGIIMGVNKMFTVCVGHVFGSKYVQFRIVCLLQYSIKINTVEVDPHSDSLQNGAMNPRIDNFSLSAMVI